MLTAWLKCTLVILVVHADNTGSPLVCFDARGSGPINEEGEWLPKTDDTVVWVGRDS